MATELHGNRVADYAECPEYIFADARTKRSDRAAAEDQRGSRTMTRPTFLRT